MPKSKVDVSARAQQLVSTTLKRGRTRKPKPNDSADHLSDVEELVTIPPEEFKEVLIACGWDAERLAKRWGMTKRRVNQIIADADRPRYYDDAIRALSIPVDKPKRAGRVKNAAKTASEA